MNSTARAAFNLGYASTVVASATATRPLADPCTGETLEAAVLKKRLWHVYIEIDEVYQVYMKAILYII